MESFKGDRGHCIRLSEDGGHRYSVPAEYVGQKMHVKITKNHVKIFDYESGVFLATHKGVSGISCPGRLLQVGNLARLPIFFMGFRLDLAFVGAEVEGPTRSVGGSSSDPTNAARAGLAHMRRRAACERPKIALL